MTRSRKFLEDFISDSFFFLVLYIIFSFIAALASLEMRNSLLLLWGLVPFYIICFLRPFVKGFALFVVLNFLPFALSILIKDIPFRIIAIFYWFSLVSLNFNRKKNSEIGEIRIEHIAFPLSVLLAFSWVSHYVDTEFMYGFYSIEAIAVFLLALLGIHFQNINSEIDLISKEARLYIKESAAFNNKVIFVCFGCALVCFLLVHFSAVDKVIAYIADLVRRVLVTFIHFEGEGGETTAVEPVSTGLHSTFNAALGAGGENPFLNKLDKVLVKIVSIGVVIFVPIFLIKLLLIYIKNFNFNNTITGDIKSFVEPKQRVEKNKKSFDIFELLLPANKVRRRYFLKVNKYFKEKYNLKMSDTPYEIRDKIISAEDITDLTREYEKIRYGREKTL